MKNLILSACLICLSVISQAQETGNKKDDNQKQENLYVKVKEGSNPDVYIDGKKYDQAIFDLLDPNKIESINIVKGEQAIKEYNAPNGVLLVSTKKGNSTIDFSIKDKSKGYENIFKVIIDDKLSNQESLSKISPKDIYSIDVIKGEKGKKEYNAPNGVIIITTKKGRKHSDKH